MKKLFLLALCISIIISCSEKQVEENIDPFKAQQKVSTASDKVIAFQLINTNEYIEKSENETLFLFKTNVGAKIDFYLAPKGEELKVVANIDNYENNGLVVDKLEVGKEYNYKIISQFQGNKIESNIESFTKETLVKTDIRPEWARNAIFYEIFVRSFYDSNGNKIGDIKGMEKQIPYLKELGIDALWLMPISPSPSYHGYDVTDYKGINEDYGNIEDFRKFVVEANKNGIRVIIDLVLNHSSSEHPWFKEALKDKNSPYRDYYVWANDFDNTKLSGDWAQGIWHGEEANKYFGIFWGGMPDLNFRNPILRNEVKEITKFWLDLGVNGFRLDASKYIDPDPKVTQLWWHDFNSFVKSINKDAFIVGENWDNSLNYVGKFMESMDSSFNFNLRDKIIDIANGMNIDMISEIKNRDKIYGKYQENFIDTIFVGNHDMTRLSNEFLNDEQKQKFAISILMTLPGTPFLYYGEEIGMEGRKPDENLREPMDWYKSAKGIGMTSQPNENVALLYTKANDGISVEEQRGKPESILEFTKKLINIRKKYGDLIVNGTYNSLENMPNRVNAYEIRNNKENLIVIHNGNSQEIEIEVEGRKFKVDRFSTRIVRDKKIIF